MTPNNKRWLVLRFRCDSPAYRALMAAAHASDDGDLRGADARCRGDRRDSVRRFEKQDGAPNVAQWTAAHLGYWDPLALEWPRDAKWRVWLLGAMRGVRGKDATKIRRAVKA